MRKERFPNGGQQKKASLRFNVPMGAFRTDLTGWENRLAISLYTGGPIKKTPKSD